VKLTKHTYLNDLLWIILSALFSLCLLSCNPERRVANILKHHPELVKTDTVWSKVSMKIPSIKIDTSIKLDKDYSKVDSIIKKYSDKLDSITRLKLVQEIKYYVTNKSVLKDTSSFEQYGVKVKVWEENGMLHYSIHKPEQVKQVNVPTIVNKVEVKEFRNWKQRISDWFVDNFWFFAFLFILLLFALIIFLYRKKILNIPKN
jgi:hypothetical protein